MKPTQKAVQYFSDEQLQRSRALSATEKMRFLDQYRQLHAQQSSIRKSKLISLKVPEDLLETFQQHCALKGVKYQTQIKQLMRDYLHNQDKTER